VEFRRDIQGLRALAVVIVILFHAQFDWIKGGYIGVDVFFVISGYLITLGLLQRKKHSFGQFYVRRIRRLFPALMTTITLTLVASFVVMSAVDFAQTAKSVIYATASFSNVGFWFDTGYWDSDAHFKPLLHTWSLSVEEQFYLLWPLMVISLLRLGKTALIITLVILISFGIIVAELYIGHDSAAVFYLTPFRAYQFAIGALAATFISVTGRNRLFNEGLLNDVVVFLGLVMVLAPAVLYDGSAKYLGALASIPCIGAILLISAGKSNSVGRLINNPVTTHIGALSYSLYLVHWPLFALYNYYIIRKLTLLDQVGLIVTTFILGSALYYLVENKFRKASKTEGKRVFSGAEFSLLMSGFMIVIIVVAAHGWANDKTLVRNIGKTVNIEQLLERTLTTEQKYRYSLLSDRCHKNRTSCFKSSTQQDNILILGDSHGIDGYNIMQQLYGDANIILGATNGCDAFINADVLYKTEERKKRCRLDNKLLFENVSMFSNLDLIVFNANFVTASIPLLKETIDYIRTVSKADIVLFSNSPIYVSPLPLIIRREKLTLASRNIPEKYLHPAFWDTHTSLKTLAQSERIIFIDKSDYFCPKHVCSLAKGDNPIALTSYDKHHLSLEAATEYGQYLRSLSLSEQLKMGSFDTPGPSAKGKSDTVSNNGVAFEGIEPDDWIFLKGKGIGSSQGMLIELEQGGSALGFNTKYPVAAGDNYIASIAVKLTEPVLLGFRIARYCGGGPIEQTVRTYDLKAGDHELEISHIFKHAQGCARLTLTSRKTPISFLLKSAVLVNRQGK
jgi:peptidoglycan/LPS O-acetylase OafA/YrhL